MISCILLSAGLSERFGSPKALATISQSTAIKHVQNTLLQSACDEIIVVLGAHAQQIQPSIFIHSRIRVVYNKNYIFGQTSSIQAGCLEANDSYKGLMFLPVDCPLVQASSIDKVIHYFKEKDPDILIPTYKNKKGHPPVFHRRLRSDILGIPVDKGLNSLFASYPPQTIEIEDPGIVKSFNTPQELADLNK